MTTTTLEKPSYVLQPVNSHHCGVEFSVARVEAGNAAAMDGFFAELAEQGWRTTMQVPCDEPGTHKFLISRKK